MMVNTVRSWISDYRAEEQQAVHLGGKGLNLFRLSQQGAPVPEFGVVSTAAYGEWILAGKVLSPSLIALIQASIDTWNTTHVAVRSSMTNEDGNTLSYAGMMESFLFVTPGDVPAMIVKCFESMSTDRVKSYERGMSQDAASQHAAVVVQKMVDATVSGVAFSRAPMGDSALLHIEAGLGLGEGIVSGLVEVDSYQVDRFCQVVHSTTTQKTKAILFDQDAHHGARVKEQSIAPAEGAKPALTTAQITVLSKMVLKLEKAMGYPVDIEWSFAADETAQDTKLYLLQIRPVTQAFPKLTYFIDTNLSESYPGVSSPLTSVFVQHGYTKTFIEAFEFLNVYPARLKALREHLNHLVTNLGGHMYYNLSSYYSVLSSLPGGRSNIERWHHMIGGAIEGGSDLSPVQPLSVFESVRSYLALGKMYLRHDHIFGKFYRYAAANRESLLEKLGRAKTAREAAQLMGFALDSTKGFGLTALNDFLIMIIMKLLMSLLERNGISVQELPSLVKTNAGVDSLRPLRDLEKLVSETANPERFFQIYREFLQAHTDSEWEFEGLYEKLYLYLGAHGYQNTANGIRFYLAQWGQRSFEELKLESLTLKQSPELLLRLMQFMSAQGQRAKSTPPASQKFDMDALGPMSKVAARVLLYYAHKTIATREKTRLIRGQYFGIVRDGMLAFAKILRGEHPKLFGTFKVNDFFALNFDSVVGYGAGRVEVEALQAEILAYGATPITRKDFPELLCMADGSKKPSFHDDEPHNAYDSSIPAGTLKGLGAARGRVEGIVLRLESPDQALMETNLQEKILVTRTTDPAWVFIMSQCRGLVSEKGSLLSHTAIIGREMGIPTVVGVPAALATLRSGDLIRIDGELGTIEILERGKGELE